MDACDFGLNSIGLRGKNLLVFASHFLSQLFGLLGKVADLVVKIEGMRFVQQGLVAWFGCGGGLV